jgi:phosphoribosylformimino-5-aminoimidazole carboxamide ribotide isomerase
MRVIPVIDLKAGVVVRGSAGRRHEYKPNASLLIPSSDPIEVAQAFRDRFALDEIYLADLDAIAGHSPTLPVYEAIRRLGFQLWVDAGVRDIEEALCLAQAGVEKTVIGLETVAGPQALEVIVRKLGNDGIAFSLDLKESLPLGDTSQWCGPQAWSIAAQAIATGVSHLIVLDLAHVGVGGGTGTEVLCRRLATHFPDVELIAGGGIGNLQELDQLSAAGVDGVLVASALHDGRLSREDLASVQVSGRHS